MTTERTRSQKEASDIINRFMLTVSEGDEDYSCNECELDTYLCPHLYERLQNMIADALKRSKAVVDVAMEWADLQSVNAITTEDAAIRLVEAVDIFRRSNI